MDPVKPTHAAYAPSAPPDAYDDDASLPMAQPVVYYDVRPPRDPHVPLLPQSHQPQPATVSEGIVLFLTNTARLTIFHVLNFALGVVAYVSVLVGSVLSVALLPLCCFGIVGFRALFALAGDFTRADVALHNWIVAPDRRFHVRKPSGHSHWATLADPRTASNASPPTHRPVLKMLYFLTLKFAVAILLSAFAVSFTYAFPVATFSVPDMRATFFSNAFGLLGFLMLSTFFLVVGTAFMKFSATLSCLITRFVCKENDSFTDFSHHAMAYPVAVPTYGTVRQDPVEPQDDRVLV